MGLGAREGEERGYGVPLSDEERWERHQQIYPGEPLPPRGSGLAGIGQTVTDYTPVIISGFFGLMSTLLIVAAIVKGRRIG